MDNYYNFYVIIYIERVDIMKKILIVLICVLFVSGCNKVEEDSMKKLMAENEYIILDVRTKEEYNEGHIVDSVNIPYDIINKDTKLDKEKIVFVYCKSGNRSKIAYENLTDLGYEVYDLGAFESIDLPKE